MYLVRLQSALLNELGVIFQCKNTSPNKIISHDIDFKIQIKIKIELVRAHTHTHTHTGTHTSVYINIDVTVYSFINGKCFNTSNKQLISKLVEN